MFNSNLSDSIKQPFWPVNHKEKINFGSPPDSVAHHKVSLSSKGNIIVSYSKYRCGPYGVSSSRRVLSPSLFNKKFDYIRDCLQNTLGLTRAQLQVVLRLLRYWCYYGDVYPSASQVSEDPGCSIATFWRTIRILKGLGLLSIVNRYVIRPHAQISNLYRLDKLVMLIIKYLAEHTAHIWPSWTHTYIHTPWPNIWDQIKKALPIAGAP